MVTYLQEVQDELRSLETQSNNGKMTQYRIFNGNGEIFTRSNGWQPFTDKVYGHMFNQNEIPLIKEVLNKHGYTNLHIELDKTGTAFMYASKSPFGNAGKMVKLMLFTLLFFAFLYIILQIDLTGIINDLN